jgi:Heterokaryon incompatibility protein (HET)
MAKASLKYSSLKDSEIRLLRFQKDATHISGFELILKSFEAGTAPPYLALSYVWGDPTKPQKIHVSSCKFDATANLSRCYTKFTMCPQLWSKGSAMRWIAPAKSSFFGTMQSASSNVELA